jgi:hypothetical protein
VYRLQIEADAKLEGIFNRNRDAFAQLVTMSEHDRHFQRIDFNFTTLDTGVVWSPGVEDFSEQRWDDYRELFRKLGLQAGIVSRLSFSSGRILWLTSSLLESSSAK